MSQLSDLCQHVQVNPATGQCRACGLLVQAPADPGTVILNCETCGQPIHRVRWQCSRCPGLQLYDHDRLDDSLNCQETRWEDADRPHKHVAPQGVRP
jgi:formate dehydrogenase maturation protein FdhE